jgi:large subunit ribosomal protein L9
VPKGLAMAVTPENKALISREKKALEARLLREKADIQLVADKIDGIRMVAPRKVGESDALYGSVTSADIAEWLAGKGIEIDKRKVQLEEPIKKLGDHEVKIRLHPEIEARLKVLVSKEG